MYETEQAVEKIEGINSISTFHRWRRYAEEQCQVRFQQRTIQVGKTSYTKIYQFSEEDIIKFQQVAELRNKGHPIKEAIAQIFTTEKPPSNQEEGNQLLFENLIKELSNVDERLMALANQMTELSNGYVLLRRDVYQLEQRLLTVEKSKLDKPFYRNKP